ncbi:hypothetical protein GCM10022631_30140 [Deinococcus rubellus]|uniref:hypothetical protein n=1 Tax=Deinococcus rubellus TaxID=1889240 RepID=UPI0031EFB0C4
MNNNTPTRPTNVSRTWAIVCFSRYEASGSTVDRSAHIVTLTANAEGKLSALVDLEETTLDRAVMLLRWAKTDGTYEQIEEVRLPVSPKVAAPIGKPRAHQLHIIMAKVGIPSGEHYAFARTATDDHDIYSLAALAGQQADAVWTYLCFCYPKAENMSVAA